MKNNKQRLFEMMEYVNPDFKAGYKPIHVYEEEEKTYSGINKILDGYIEAALWTEEERLRDDAREMNPPIRDDDYYDEEDESEEEKKFLRIMKSKETKTIESFSREDINPDSLIKAYTDLTQFIKLAGNDALNEAIVENGFEQLGHDIWLTRNGHGAGFFDHSYDYEAELMNAAKALREVDLYIGDDGKLYFSNEHVR
jgi:hypothetical protein